MKSSWLTAFFLIAGLAQSGFGQGIGDLNILPTRATFDDANRMVNFTILNRGPRPVRYRLSLIDMDMNPDGTLQKSTGVHPLTAQSFVRFAPHEIELAPGEWQKIKVLVQIPQGTPDGEYRSHLAFNPVTEIEPKADSSLAQPKNLQIQLRMQTAVTLPLFVRHGHLTASASLSDLKFDQNGTNKTLSFKIAREGNASVRGDVHAWFIGSDGIRTELAKVLELPVYFPNPFRLVTLPMDTSDLHKGPGTMVIEYGTGDHLGQRLKISVPSGF